MFYKLTTAVIGLALMFIVAGCKVAGDTSGSNSYVASGGSVTESVDSPDGDDPITHHNPEPATVALLGGGLLAYALLRRKKAARR